MGSCKTGFFGQLFRNFSSSGFSTEPSLLIEMSGQEKLSLLYSMSVSSVTRVCFMERDDDDVCVPQGCLPLVLMFDIKEDIEVEPHCITALMEQLDVFISIKPKPKQPSKVPH